MGEFQRETASWLVRQPFWLSMATCQKESWLEFREGVTIQHEDILFIRDMERASMEQQDIVEMSRYRWVDLNHEERQSLQEYQGAWEVLGGGQIVAARFANKARCIGPRKRGCPFAANPRADSQPPSPPTSLAPKIRRVCLTRYWETVVQQQRSITDQGSNNNNNSVEHIFHAEEEPDDDFRPRRSNS